MKEEDAFQRDLLKLAKTYGWKVHHSRKTRTQRHDGSTHWHTPLSGDAGYVDVTLAKNGVVVHAELKSNTGRMTADQQAWAKAIGTTHRLWRPRDWPEIVKLLSGGMATGKA